VDKKEITIMDDNATRKQKFTFLPDFPTCSDDFGCHKRIADSIAYQISSDEESKIIGLEGPWGSGKSSIIKMLEKKWEGDKNIKVFTYDAWEHQGDHLRRAFLEELIKSLTKEDCKWLENCHSDKFSIESCERKCTKNKREACPDYVVNNLRQRYEYNVVNTEPHISKGGIIFGIATLLMPIGLAAYESNKWYIKTISLLLMLAPALVVFFKILWLLKNKKNVNNLLGDFFGKSEETAKYTTQKTPEPTTIEFQEYYWNLLNKALENKERRLVIVVDNLDRVDSDDALKIWSTLKTFLDDKKPAGVDDRIWVIVPYAHDKIDKLWTQNGDKELALHFKEKTFQIRYHVPEPLTSKWEDYFHNKLTEAIEINNKDIHNCIFNIFRIIALPKYKNIPTPREMKIFINRIVSLAFLFYETKDASLEEIALYAAFELAHPDKFQQLATTEIEKEKVITQIAGSDFRRGLAAIHYGVKREEADEVIYKPIIEECIKSGDCEELTPMLNSPVAQTVCRNYLHDIAYCWQNLSEFLSASEALSDFEPENSSWNITQCFETLSHHMLTNVSFDSFKPKGSLTNSNVLDLIRIMAFCPDISNKIIDRLSITLTKEYFGEKAKDEIFIEATSEQINEKLSQWVSAVIPIVKHIENKNEDSTIRLYLGKSEHYATLIGFVHSQDIELIKYFCPKARVKKDYFNACIAEIKSGTITPRSVKIIESILKMQVVDDTDKALIAQGITPAYSKFNAEQISLMYDILYQNRKIEYFKEELEKLVTGNLAFNVLSKFVNTPIAAARCLINIFLFSKNLPANISPPFQDVLNDPKENVIAEVSKTIHTYNIFEDICNSLSDEIKVSKCWGEVLRSFVSNKDLISNIIVKIFLADHSCIKNHLDMQFDNEDKKENYYDILVKYLARKGLLGELEKKPISSDFGKTYYLIISDDEIDTKKLEKKVCEEFEHVKIDIWYEELCNESSYYGFLDIIIELIDKEHNLSLGDKFTDALIKHAKALMNHEEDVEEVGSLANSWDKLLQALSDSYRDKFREELLEVVLANDGSILSLPEVYKDEIKIVLKNLDNKPIMKTHRKDFIHHPCIKIVENKNLKELDWMFDILCSDKKLLKEAQKSHREIIKDSLKDFLFEEYNKESNEDNESGKIEKIIIQDIAKQLGINLEKQSLDNELHHLLINNKWTLFYNPNKPNAFKPMVFGKGGEIIAGKNNNESSWRIPDGHLEMVNSEGKIHSRFIFDKKTMRFNHTNDPDTCSVSRDSIKDQYMILNEGTK